MIQLSTGGTGVPVPPTVTSTNFPSQTITVNGVNCTITPYITVAAGFSAETISGEPQAILISFNKNVADFSISVVNNKTAGTFIIGYDAAGTAAGTTEAASSTVANASLRVAVSAPAGGALRAVRLFPVTTGIAWANISITPTPATAVNPTPAPTTSFPPPSNIPAPVQNPPTTQPVQTPPVSQPPTSTPTPPSQTTPSTNVPTSQTNPSATTVPVATPDLVVFKPVGGGVTTNPVTTPTPTTGTPNPVTAPPVNPTVTVTPNPGSQTSASLAVGLDTIVQISTQQLDYVYVLNTMTPIPSGSFTIENVSNYIDLNVSIAAAAGVIFTPSSFVLPNLTTQAVTVTYDMKIINQLQAGLNDLSSIITLSSNQVLTNNPNPTINNPTPTPTPPPVSVNINNWLEQRFHGSPGKYGKMPESAIFAQTPFLTQVVDAINYTGANQINAPTTVRWTSTWDFGTSGQPWLISLTTDDGMRVFIDNVMVLNAWIEQSATPYSTQVTYNGQHTVRVEYFNDVTTGTAIFSLVQLPITTPTQIPTPTGFPTPSGKSFF